MTSCWCQSYCWFLDLLLHLLALWSFHAELKSLKLLLHVAASFDKSNPIQEWLIKDLFFSEINERNLENWWMHFEFAAMKVQKFLAKFQLFLPFFRCFIERVECLNLREIAIILSPPLKSLNINLFAAIHDKERKMSKIWIWIDQQVLIRFWHDNKFGNRRDAESSNFIWFLEILSDENQSWILQFCWIIKLFYDHWMISIKSLHNFTDCVFNDTRHLSKNDNFKENFIL